MTEDTQSAIKEVEVDSKAPRPLTQRDRVIFVILTLILFIMVFRPVLVYMSVWRGDQYWMTGSLDDGVRSYKKALLLDPNNADLRATLGYVNSKFQRHEEAAKEYAEAIRVDPDNPDTHYYLGLSLFELKKYDQAAGHFKDSIKLDSKQPLAYLMLGNAMEKLGKRSEALKTYLNLKQRFNNMKGIDERIQKLRQQ